MSSWIFRGIFCFPPLSDEAFIMLTFILSSVPVSQL